MHMGFDSWFKQNFHGILTESNRFVTMYLALDKLLNHGGNMLVETGTLRKENNLHDGLSTLVFGSFCARYNRNLHTVDASAEAMRISRKATHAYKDFISYHVTDSVSFLKSFNQKIDLLYLDSMDCPSQESETSPQLLASQSHQLNEIKAAFDKLPDEAVVLLDDNDFPNGGKTRFAKLFLKETGFREMMSWKQSLWLRQ